MTFHILVERFKQKNIIALENLPAGEDQRRALEGVLVGMDMNMMAPCLAEEHRCSEGCKALLIVEMLVLVLRELTIH